jgi:hypothetical protein
MRWAKQNHSLSFCLGLLLGLGITVMPLMAIAAIAEFKPPKRGMPGKREGGGTRGASLTALLPKTNFGLTTAAYPRFFWYVPKAGNLKYVEFTLFEGDIKIPDRILVYKTTFTITGEPGIVSLTLPSDAGIPPLTVGKDYHWSVKLFGDLTTPQKGVKVDGWVQRINVPPSLAKQLATADLKTRTTLYADSGLWFDTLTALAEARCAFPADPSLKETWTTLLKTPESKDNPGVKLDVIANQPLIQQCNK